jgi:purine-nucleoside phosphorylase
MSAQTVTLWRPTGPKELALVEASVALPEVIAGRHMEMRILGLTIVTDLCLPDALEPVDVQTIIRTAKNAEPRLTALIRDVVRDL